MKLSRIFLLLLLLVPYFPSHATIFNNSMDEQNEKLATWWINLGYGRGWTFDDHDVQIRGGHGGNVSFNGAFNKNIFLTLYTNHVGSNNYWNDDASDAGVMIGYVKRQPKWYWSTSAGICYYEMDSYRNRRSEMSGAGLPLQAQLFWTPLKHFGFGLIGHGVVSDNPYASALLAIQVYS